jgi:hypothetical protein
VVVLVVEEALVVVVDLVADPVEVSVQGAV